MVNLTERVGELESKMDGVQRGVEDIRGNVQAVERNVAVMLEQFAFMRMKWDELERERKNKSKEREGPSEFTMDSEVTPGVVGGCDSKGGIGGGYQSDLRGKRLEMPIFEGENPNEWIFRAERYFAVNQLTDEEKIESATLCFKAAALSWFQWETRQRGIRSWEGLKQGILGRFRPTQEGLLEERFLALRQEGSVKEYRLKFETMAAAVPDVPEAFLEGQFLNGLNPEIRAEIRVLQPRGLDRIMVVAQNIEDKNVALQNCHRATRPTKSGYSITPTIASRMSPVPAKSLGSSQKSVNMPGPRFHPTGNGGNFPFKKLSEAEWKARREKGLCFHCDEKYLIGHRCKNKELQVLIYDEEMGEAAAEEEAVQGDDGSKC
ncbi:uncharacterized protein LOC127801242 [Diospyros lotus]|uniref:uncharacterized protein LOC127801242 n=1 Tax=Diospyros lotus TaxID=55363 RepID=UPI00224D8162|nr:uncharacterized protein LOC127801242 [Diospyros lotus]